MTITRATLPTAWVLGPAARQDPAQGDPGVMSNPATSIPAQDTRDLVMPEHDGRHAWRGIMELDPEAKVLVVRHWSHGAC